MPETIKVYNGDQIVLTYDQATNSCTWHIPENERPTGIENPIVVEKIDDADNTSGYIYRITWKVRDGTLLSTDDYYLEYEVHIDTDEANFEYDTYFPTNSSITAYYYGSNGVLYNEDIAYPIVKVQKSED